MIMTVPYDKYGMFFYCETQGSRDPQAIFDCVSGWGSYEAFYLLWVKRLALFYDKKLPVRSLQMNKTALVRIAIFKAENQVCLNKRMSNR